MRGHETFLEASAREIEKIRYLFQLTELIEAEKPIELSKIGEAVPVSGKAKGNGKWPLFLLEALGSLANGYYGNFVFFRFRKDYGFGDFENLLAASFMGLIMALASWWGGRFAQRYGCFRAITLGLMGLIVSLGIGYWCSPLPWQLVGMGLWTASQFMIWPALEALVTEGVHGNRRARVVGSYSVVWASCAALSYFFGGGWFDRFGSLSIFWLPPLFHAAQLLIVWRVVRLSQPTMKEVPDASAALVSQAERSVEHSRLFQRMAWLANPFACVAAFTLLALIPQLSARMGLSVTQAGAFGSIWFFARLIAFIILWRWSGWHYQFRWLLGGYLLLMLGFAVTLIAGHLVWLSLGQVAFGLAVGLLYYASLFYSMDVGEARAEQGGIHEAMMGAGNFLGPGIGAVGLLIVPQQPHAGVWAVSGLLAFGLVGLSAMWWRRKIVDESPR